ncbi:IscS subfamily cysteine desulfurase [Pseudohaliea rubra]|uniref:cysteine desulfurase n=1 Tax=Pseudohaliea rubra DSM 19751 TaxID=1265313 RepID=A0A095X290_9GAMM|nr:IscS subfamily cysteine desulfurase [Pseudohaliea rubra]KGE04994.1 Cysteine desulfurase, IscS subfamily [Pseudohaliea rubra DSM 19751]
MKRPIYLDYLATTPVDPRVAEAMAACLTLDGTFGNPASRSHRYGWEAEMCVENARRDVAELIGADPRELVWTSGATEADNLAIKGVLRAAGERGHIVTSAIEHKAVLDTCRYLEGRGVAVTYLAPEADGLIAPASVAAALRDDTRLVSIMHANNEIGTVNDIAAIGAIAREAGVTFHVDAAQSAGKLPLNVSELPVDLLSLSAHKFYGPKGVGALYVRRRAQLSLVPQMHGGGHERGLRAGTLATHQLVGMGTAAALARDELGAEAQRLTALRERLREGLEAIGDVTVNGHGTARLPGALNVAVGGVEGETLLLALKDLALSTGSACTSASVEPSYVLRALGLPDALAHSSLRFGLGRFTTAEEIEQAVAQVAVSVQRLRPAAAISH